MLMSSLPHLPSLFTARETPLSRLQLDQRLRMLERQDADILRCIQTLMSWNRLSLDTSDQRVAESFEELMVQLDNHICLQELVKARFELLTILAALRRRRRGESAPARRVRWGYHPWVSHIVRHWTEPGFRLEKAFPWMLEAGRHLEAGDPVSLERLLMTTVWKHLTRASEGHYFDFEAVAIYALRFDLVEYWTEWDQSLSRIHFQTLLEAGLGPYHNLFP